MKPETIPIAVIHCARCGKDHERVKFTTLKSPPAFATHFAMCPEINQPILLRIESAPYETLLDDLRLLEESYED
jgi:hypothetical protein